MELKLITYIKEHGLEKTLSDFSLKSKDYGHKVIIKYDQIGSNFTDEEVREARGIILEKDTWKIMSWAFYKFFNSEEGHCAKVDFDNAKILEKCDGTMIQLYYDWVTKEWCAGTTGTAEGEGEVNNRLNTTFNTLFWDTFTKLGGNKDSLSEGNTYVFELMTPYNIVVKPHAESSLRLLTIRNLERNLEYDYYTVSQEAKTINIPIVQSFDFPNVSNFGHLKKMFETMPWSDEGYVVVDNNFNRAKLKNPAYVAVHHLKGKTAEHNIISIVKTNEVDEFVATFPEREEEIYKLQTSYNKLKSELKFVWGILKTNLPKNITKNEQKRFAMLVFDTMKKHGVNSSFSGLFFGLKDRKINSVDDFLFNYDNKTLYKIL